ncbi:M67 family metallopeptidase [Rhizorhabdus sp.]|uniref:M67 family metallopeptidase n=1 Tax=Rhizorhabdus sp. TaxID=1968843 RepID=UPI001B494EB2|nr:M67 family metallopeptidase [Rhizorhabdus sp.]MBP8234945.1 M67 family metallopeptidase [Rhizorhabdus sp.]
MPVRISRVLLDAILSRAAASPGLEVCGLLLGRGETVERVEHCRNVAVDPHSSFEVDPGALIAAHRVARAGGPSLLGHYHSHPNGIAAPSDRDRAAAEPGSLWIIAAGSEIKAWRAASNGGFAPVELVVD